MRPMRKEYVLCILLVLVALCSLLFAFPDKDDDAEGDDAEGDGGCGDGYGGSACTVSGGGDDDSKENIL